MAFGRLERSAGPQPMGEINMTPLIDVMLVLLVIFIITAPLLTHAVKIDLPKAASHPNLTRPDHIALSINAANEMFWNGERIDHAQLTQRMAASARLNPQPELHLRADKATQYQVLAAVMAAAGKAGLARIGFVSDPTNPE